MAPNMAQNICTVIFDDETNKIALSEDAQHDIPILSIDAETMCLVDQSVEDPLNWYILAWITNATAPMSVKALDTAMALMLKSDCVSLEELNEHRPGLSEESLKNSFGKALKFPNDKVSFTNQPTHVFCSQKSDVSGERPLERKSIDFLMAEACVTYLSLENFRNLPLPTDMKGYRGDLERSDPFLTYASRSWHRHVQSVEHAKMLQTKIDLIIDPALNYLYLWTDQSSTWAISGARTFFRTRSEVAIFRDIPWLVLYLVDTTLVEPEQMFPAKDLLKITKDAPGVLETLIGLKPDYYLPAIQKRIHDLGRFTSLDTFKTILRGREDMALPANVLRRVACNKEGHHIFEYLFSLRKTTAITSEMLRKASSNCFCGASILRLLFQKDPSIQITENMVAAAMSMEESDNLRVLLEQDKEAPVSDFALDSWVRMTCKPDNLEVLLKANPNITLQPTTVHKAIKLNRSAIVKFIFETFKDLEISEETLCLAAKSDGHGMDVAEYLFARCDPSRFTANVMLAAIARLNSADKMVELLLRHCRDIPISNEMLVASATDWDGKVLDSLLERQERTEVPHELVDSAIEQAKHQLGWTWRPVEERLNEPSLLKTLQKRVSEDPYLKKALMEMDFSPAPPPPPPDYRSHSTAIADAAGRSKMSEVKRLLEMGVDINATHGSSCNCDRNRGHGTALQRSVKNRDIELAKLLLVNGARTDYKEGAFGDPLQEAAKLGDLEMVELLVSYGAEFNCLGGRRKNALSAAAKADDVKITQFLLEQGADVNIADEHGWTPYLYAVAAESDDVIRFFRTFDHSIAAMGELIALQPERFQMSHEKSSIGISEDGLTVNTGRPPF